MEASLVFWLRGFSKYQHADNEAGAGCGRICIFINPSIKYLVQNQGSIGRNLAQWIRFSGFQEGNVAVLNVYAPHTPHKRIQLWQDLRRDLPSDCKWITCRDWNVVEDNMDKSTRCGRILNDMELIEFNALKAQLSV